MSVTHGHWTRLSTGCSISGISPASVLPVTAKEERARFMSLVKSGQIANCCAPNALMTLKEYLEDYASEDTRKKGLKLIEKETEHIPNPKIREIAIRNLKAIAEGKRDFRL